MDLFLQAQCHSYRGRIQGDDSEGVVDIEFPALRHAAAWVIRCNIEDRVALRADSVGRRFSESVIVQYFPHEKEES